MNETLRFFSAWIPDVANPREISRMIIADNQLQKKELLRTLSEVERAYVC